MMKLSIIAFTRDASRLALRVEEALQDVVQVTVYAKPLQDGCEMVTGSLQEWCGEQFLTQDALLFVSAAGIAIRGIAPFVKDKFTDIAVLVMDEKGQFVIPLLSGHVGGANKLAGVIAERMGVTPVLTTATDLSHVFAVDVFAVEHDLAINAQNREQLKQVSASLLKGQQVGFFVKNSIQVTGLLPKELFSVTEDSFYQMLQNQEREESMVIAVTDEILPVHPWLVPLIPRCHVLGIGCKKNTSPDHLKEMLLLFLQKHHLAMESIACIASIDLKKDEKAILQLAKEYEKPFYTYGAEALMEVSGEFHSSAFVLQTTGADNVCERAAVVAACSLWQQGEIQIARESYDGVTFAIAGIEKNTDWRIRIE